MKKLLNELNKLQNELDDNWNYETLAKRDMLISKIEDNCEKGLHLDFSYNDDKYVIADSSSKIIIK